MAAMVGVQPHGAYATCIVSAERPLTQIAISINRNCPTQECSQRSAVQLGFTQAKANTQICEVIWDGHRRNQTVTALLVFAAAVAHRVGRAGLVVPHLRQATGKTREHTQCCNTPVRT